MTSQPLYFKLWLRWKRQLLSRPRLIKAALLISVITITSWGLYRWLLPQIPITQLWHSTNNTVQAFIDPTTKLKQSLGYTNILLLGVGGAGHEAPDLTDSIIIASIDLHTGSILLLSIPRDIWIPSLRAKINTAYHYGRQMGTLTDGQILAKAAVSEVTDLPIHYIAVLDFNGFTKLVDLLGGINLNIEHTFDDYRYPIPGQETAESESARYERLHFEAGQQQLSGEQTLKYVRSRNSEGVEGTDLARSERQKKVILAIKDRLLSTKVIANKAKLKSLYQLLSSSIQTDLSFDLLPAFTRLALNFSPDLLTSAYLPVYLKTDNGNSASDSALLINPPISVQHDYQWVLTPRELNFQFVHKFVQCLLQHPQEFCENDQNLN